MIRYKARGRYTMYRRWDGRFSFDGDDKGFNGAALDYALALPKAPDGRSVLQTVPRVDRGRYDTWLGYDNNNSPWDTWLHGHDRDEKIAHYRLPGFETEGITDLALQRIEARKGSDTSPLIIIPTRSTPRARPQPAEALRSLRVGRESALSLSKGLLAAAGNERVKIITRTVVCVDREC